MGKYSAMLKRARESVEYWTQEAMRRFVGEALRRMEEQQISRTQLATNMNVSTAYVTKILRGDVNFTLESMVKLSRAVGGRLSVSIVDEKQAVTERSFDVDVPVAIAHANASVVHGRAVVQGGQTRQLQLPQGATFAWQLVGQDDYYCRAA